VYRNRVTEGSLECLGIPGGRHLSQPWVNRASKRSSVFLQQGCPTARAPQRPLNVTSQARPKGAHRVAPMARLRPSQRAPESGVHGPSHSTGGSGPRTDLCRPGLLRGLGVRSQARRCGDVPCLGRASCRRVSSVDACSRRGHMEGNGLISRPFCGGLLWFLLGRWSFSVPLRGST
jgi:hypothetical protein